jgi:hypothetical protein
MSEIYKSKIIFEILIQEASSSDVTIDLLDVYIFIENSIENFKKIIFFR